MPGAQFLDSNSALAETGDQNAGGSAGACGAAVLATQCPHNMEQGFFDQLARAEIPQTLINVMAKERITTLAALPRYAIEKKEVVDFIING